LQVAKRSVVSFYDDQGTHHAAALTYYALMSLFPTLLLAVSLLGLLGEFPGTYESIVGHLRGVVPATTLAPLDTAVREALKSKGTAAAGLLIAIVTALYGATGYLEAARRALNVVFKASRGRSFRAPGAGAHDAGADFRRRGRRARRARARGSLGVADRALAGGVRERAACVLAHLLLVWLWLTNVALLFGAEVNAEIDRVVETAEGVPKPETPRRPS